MGEFEYSPPQLQLPAAPEAPFQRSVGLLIKYFDSIEPMGEVWDEQAAQPITIVSQNFEVNGKGHDERTAYFNPEFHTMVRLADRRSVLQRINLFKYMVEYTLPSGESILQFRRQIMFPADNAAKNHPLLKGRRPTIVIHEQSPEFPEKFPERFEVGNFVQHLGDGVQSKFEFFSMRISRTEDELRKLTDLFMRIIQKAER